MTYQFVKFPKIPRLCHDYVVTEKLDGTNAAVWVGEDGEIRCQSRNREITVDADNHGFAAWCHDNRDGLVGALKPGYHFGEWWGQGINRGYGLKERRFSLFNVSLANMPYDEQYVAHVIGEPPMVGPCHVVPVFAWGSDFGVFDPEGTTSFLSGFGSVAAPGFQRPEGWVVWHQRANQYFKHPFDKEGR